VPAFLSICSAYLLLSKASRKAFIVTIVIPITSIFTTLRGTQGSHSVPYYYLSCFTLLIIINSNYIKKHNFKINSSRKIVITTILAAFFMYNLYPIVNRNKISDMSNVIGISRIAETLLKQKDGIFLTDLDLNPYVELNRVPGLKIPTPTPWFFEKYEEDILSELEEKQVKLISYNPDNLVWGYRLGSYSPKLDEYIENNYKEVKGNYSLAKCSNQKLYAIRSSYDDFENELVLKFPDSFGIDYNPAIESKSFTKEDRKIVGEITKESEVSQKFYVLRNNLSNIRILMANFARKNSGVITFQLKDEQGKRIAENKVDASSICDNLFLEISIPAIANSANKTYELSISSNSELNNAVTAWTLPSMNEDFFVKINKQPRAESLILELGYKKIR